MRTLTTIALTLLSATASAGLFNDDCRYTEPRSAAAPLAGATRIVIVGRAGELRVAGAHGAKEVRAKGTACASERDALSRITLTATRQGSDLRIEANLPEIAFGWNHNALDFEVSVPDNLPLLIDDTSGELRVEGVGAAEIHDSSGALHVRDVSGDLRIDDTSGEITVEHVGGHVTIDDSSGTIEVDDAGVVDIPSDGSGAVEIRHVKRNVTIDSKGSGSVSVSDVGGDFIVHHKGSGSIDAERVAGRIDIPRRRR
jgi:DUF4097 and DUF4098 domain-containing protein YvlB